MMRLALVAPFLCFCCAVFLLCMGNDLRSAHATRHVEQGLATAAPPTPTPRITNPPNTMTMVAPLQPTHSDTLAKRPTHSVR